MRLAFFIGLFLFTNSLSSCGQKKDYLVTIKTEYGDMKVILFDDTPLHKKNFIKLAQAGDYDSTIFHRVMKDFMIQGGDVNAKQGVPPSKEDLMPAEFSAGHIHRKGALAAARQPDNINPEKKSSENQFYLVQGQVYTEEALTLDEMKLNQYFGQLMNKPEYATLREEMIELQRARDMAAIEAKVKGSKELIEQEFGISLAMDISAEQLAAYTTDGGTPHLDGEYTVFGQVIEGIEIIDAIANQPVGSMHKPVKDIHMLVTVEEMKKSKITKLYGYSYEN